MELPSTQLNRESRPDMRATALQRAERDLAARTRDSKQRKHSVNRVNLFPKLLILQMLFLKNWRKSIKSVKLVKTKNVGTSEISRRACAVTIFRVAVGLKLTWILKLLIHLYFKFLNYFFIYMPYS